MALLQDPGLYLSSVVVVGEVSSTGHDLHHLQSNWSPGHYQGMHTTTTPLGLLSHAGH